MQNDIEVFDNILSEQEALGVYAEFISPHFPWYMSSVAKLVNNEFKISTTSENYNIDENTFEAFQINHMLYKDKIASFKLNVADFIHKKLSEKVDLSEYNFVHRIKANLLPRVLSGPDHHNTPHYDNKNEHIVVIYYVNNSDGDTFIFESDKYPLKVKKRITPKMGRFVIFNGNQLHAGVHPKTNEYRIVVNFNLTKVDSNLIN